MNLFRPTLVLVKDKVPKNSHVKLRDTAREFYQARLRVTLFKFVDLFYTMLKAMVLYYNGYQNLPCPPVLRTSNYIQWSFLAVASFNGQQLLYGNVRTVSCQNLYTFGAIAKILDERLAGLHLEP